MWIKTTAGFIPQDISEEEFECYGKEAQKEVLDTRQFRFRTEEMVVYNESSEGLATIRMKNGYEITINMTVKEIDVILENDVNIK